MAAVSSSRLKGDRYQHLYSWFELLPLLDDVPPYEYAILENVDAGSADDITLHPVTGSGKVTRFIQVKFHVDQRNTYSFDSLIELVGTSKTSLLAKLFKTWRKLRSQGPVEIWLVSNWAAHTDLGSFVAGDSAAFRATFYECAKTGTLKEIHDKIISVLNTDDDELHKFCSDLRFRLAYEPTSELQRSVDDRMARYHLQTGDKAQALAMDAVKKWIEQEQACKITVDVLNSKIKELGLYAEEPDSLPAVWIHGWVKQTYDENCLSDLDWTHAFDRDSRRVPTQLEWESELYPMLKETKTKLNALPKGRGKKFDLRGKVSLSISVAIGATFPKVAGYVIRTEQPTPSGVKLWASDEQPSAAALIASKLGIVEHQDAENIIVSLSITGDAGPDVLAFANASNLNFFSATNLTPSVGASSSAVSSGSDCNAYSISAREIIRKLKNENRRSTIHLFIYGPASIALFLGQYLNALGNIILYEKSPSGDYVEALSLATG
jgi:hypothetical protein